MNLRDFTGPEAPADLLAALLDDSAIPFSREGDRFRFLLTARGLRWETLCQCRSREVLIYGRYPFRPQAGARVLETCNEVNALVLRGGMLLWEGELLFRTCALCDRPLDAAETLAAALEYNAAVVAEFWPLLQRAAAQPDS